MKKQIVPIAVIAVILLAGLALWFGLRGGESSPLSPGESAPGVTIFAPENTQVIVVKNNESEDEGEELTTEAEEFIVSASGRYNLDLETGNYTLLVSRGDDYYPWSKTVDVFEDTATEFYPILFPREVELETLTSSDDAYSEVSTAFSVPATLPTSENPKQNADGTAEVYVEGNTIFVAWLGETEDMPEFLCPGENTDECRLLPVFEFEAGTVENIEFYGEHDEALLLDRGPMIAVLEIDRRGGIDGKNQHPIHIGAAVAFRLIDGDIYISEGGVISRVVFQ